ncbi:uncharacterized protein K02A2.6-like [Haliotis rufescens]|uniref:uncharacterized protein K02A2.6-like n=1 Tax=Haliotis rufescens TaxID=6454 RepID=UPI00201F157F|nr:uncharacterized protein K02A2.6-like [Haliotis rufescens]
MSIEANYPWENVGTDLFTFEDQEYLLTIDYFSGFWEVDYLPKTTSLAVIKSLKIHFSRHGIPNQLISDNGPQFVSKEFSSFTKVWDIVHCTSSPRHPNANGKAESGVKAAKTMMSKWKSSKMDPYLCLLELRNTLTQNTGTSPTQKLFSRRTRSVMPMSNANVKRTADAWKSQ